MSIICLLLYLKNWNEMVRHSISIGHILSSGCPHYIKWFVRYLFSGFYSPMKVFANDWISSFRVDWKYRSSHDTGQGKHLPDSHKWFWFPDVHYFLFIYVFNDSVC
jgi:hypothetical protein